MGFDTKLLLQQATDYAYQRFKLKSPNKYYPEKLQLTQYKLSKGKVDSAEEADVNIPATMLMRRHFHSHQMDEWRDNNLQYLREKTLYNENDAIANIKELNMFIDRLGYPAAGNCDELSHMAYDYIINYLQKTHDNSTNIALVTYEPPYDHVFIILTKTTNKILKDFIGVDAGVEYVCDPWARINCRIENYPNLWKQKMLKWANRGLMIRTNSNTLSPLSALVMNAPLLGRVRLLDQRL